VFQLRCKLGRVHSHKHRSEGGFRVVGVVFGTLGEPSAAFGGLAVSVLATGPTGCSVAGSNPIFTGDKNP
jgi:hypothetical protein